MSEFPDRFCPNCGRELAGNTFGCPCGHSFYPRPPQPKIELKAAQLSEEEKRAASAKAGMFLGFVSLAGPLALYYGIFIALLAFGLSMRGRNSPNAKQARIGIICSLIGGTFWIVGLIVFLVSMSRSS